MPAVASPPIVCDKAAPVFVGGNRLPSSPLVDIQLIRGKPDGMALGVAIEPGAEDLESMRRAFFWAIRVFKRTLPKATL